jgi:hypothetical protein
MGHYQMLLKTSITALCQARLAISEELESTYNSDSGRIAHAGKHLRELAEKFEIATQTYHALSEGLTRDNINFTNKIGV